MTQGLEMPGLAASTIFAFAVLAGIVSAVVFSGHFPLDETTDDSSMKRLRIPVLIILGIATFSILGVSGVYAYGILPWYASIMIGGLAVLTGPLCEQMLPVKFKSELVGLGVISCFDLVLAGWILSEV